MKFRLPVSLHRGKERTLLVCIDKYLRFPKIYFADLQKNFSGWVDKYEFCGYNGCNLID